MLKEYAYSVYSSRTLKGEHNHMFFFLVIPNWVFRVLGLFFFFFLCTLLSLPSLPLIVFLLHLLCPEDILDLETLWRTCMEAFAFQHIHNGCFRCLFWWQDTLLKWSQKGICVASYDGNKISICTLPANWGAI